MAETGLAARWSHAARRTAAVQDRAPVLQMVAVLAVYLLCVLTISGFGNWSSIVDVLVLASFTGIASVGQTLVALLGGLDLSIPSVLGAANVAICQMTTAWHWPFPAAAAAILLASTAVGWLNGYLSEKFAIHSLLVTIGSGAIIAGVMSAWTAGQSTAPAPNWMANITSPAAHTWILPVPPVVVIWAALSAIVISVLRSTAYGRRLYATGANPRAARLARVRPIRIWSVTFAISGAAAAMTGMILAGYTGSGLLTVGDQYLVTTIACVVIGGTSLLGGQGDYVRSILGALLLTEVTTMLVGFNLGAAAQQAMLGLMIIAVVSLHGRELHVRNRV